MNLPQLRDAFTLACHPSNEVTVNDHDSFGPACGTTGVHHHSQIRRLGLHNWPFHCKTKQLLYGAVCVRVVFNHPWLVIQTYTRTVLLQRAQLLYSLHAVDGQFCWVAFCVHLLLVYVDHVLQFGDHWQHFLHRRPGRRVHNTDLNLV